MGIGDAVLAKMENRRREHRARMAFTHAVDQMIKVTDAAAGDNGDVDRIGNCAGECEVIAVTCTVTVHAGDEQFACAKLGELYGMFERVNSGWFAPAMGEDFPMVAAAPRINRSHHALAAETCGDIRNDLRPRNRCAVDRNLIRACQQQRARILCAAHAATDGQRHEAYFRGTPDHINDRAAPFMACANVQKAKLIRARRIICLRLLHRVTGVAQVDKVHTLDHAAIGYVEAGNDTDADGHPQFAIDVSPQS